MTPLNAHVDNRFQLSNHTFAYLLSPQQLLGQAIIFVFLVSPSSFISKQEGNPSNFELGTCISFRSHTVSPAAPHHSWDVHNGSNCWTKSFPCAAGAMQSPVDIKTKLVCQDSQLIQRPLYWSYVPNNCKSLLNTGGGWKVSVEGLNSCLTGGPLANSYQLLQFHCHWGRCPNSGSEHTVDGRAYAAELHLVHWNADLYNSPQEATTSPQGLAVVGVFFEVGRRNEELSKITDILHEIPNKGEECPLLEVIHPAAFFPDDLEYWTYEGSLTTPPYSESVTWIVFKKPIEISEKQLETLRAMNSSTAEICDDGYPVMKKVEENCRVVQPINGREIREAPY